MKVDYSKALKLAICCKESYQNFSNIKFSGWSEQPFLIDQKDTDTQLAILTDTSGITIVFPGSNSSFDWRTNLETSQEQTKFDKQIIQSEIVDQNDKIYPYLTENSSGSLMHSGFIKAYFSVRNQIHEYIKNNNISRVTVSGHSLGGALATLCVVDIQYNFVNQLASIESFTFGAPKVGNKGFQESYNQRVPSSYQFVNGMDIVPELPRWWQGYRHIDQELRIGSRFSLNFIAARFQDHAISNYISTFKEILSRSGN
ncbi:lipase family protein [Anabaena cylindrica FACHB-243]|uniref:Lipase class 3 n=1 Tax=Anabaena cylindrica (strain ATCC 27899 / PCC 7122) TaxID=272123 RepID=K9ZAZ3_ANACC|nr:MULTISPECIES: lipase family protein [Anabaena]AFZ56346.1 lipase class 3 [Anabaena cylindrica PCC 7122]MBD2418206.1 lipase family protein [Anabaena cylindrica FACHB-243]MBY5283945.1 lipase family protein [Anabaena sp. CCAP 1446/1C]MBY5308033.1 lipase family protein [Anabaena sp. CCAP 1446/1C]MCM2409072.1 lipase family protein [Anabaena sp. CCAP 1446/1C]